MLTALWDETIIVDALVELIVLVVHAGQRQKRKLAKLDVHKLPHWLVVDLHIWRDSLHR